MKYHGTLDLIWQSDIRISTFPSGLVLAQRSAMCPKTISKREEIAVGDAMPVEHTPVIDGLFIFPAPQETRTPAYTTYDVSAYGRTSNEPRVSRQTKVVKGIGYTVFDVTRNIIITAEEQMHTGVIASDEDVPLIVPTLPASIIISYELSNGATGSYPQVSYWTLSQITRTNYGSWDEYSFNWGVFIPDPIRLPV